MIEITINGEAHRLDVPPDTPLLWVLRDHLGLAGTKFGCGIGQCGACTVHLDGVAQKTCILPVSAVGGRAVTTIEALGRGTEAELHPIQQAWIEGSVAQCGYCQSGQIMAAAALLDANPAPTDADIDQAMSGNLCRCGTYPRIRRAIHRAAELERRGETLVRDWDPEVDIASIGGLPA